MSNDSIKQIFPLVERPSRYLGTEVNTVKKDLQRVKLKFALAFPDMYEIGTSHFGMQILYTILNQHPQIAAERVFAPGMDLQTRLRASGESILTLESQAPLNRFDIVGFSLLYELNYTNVLSILDLAGIPFLAADRDASHPFIIAGGTCTCNPEPVADFFDAIVIGDGETVIEALAHTWLQWKEGRDKDRQTLLRTWSKLEGVYIPSFFEPEYDQDGYQRLIPRFEDYTRVTRAVVPDLEQVPFPDKPIVPYGKPVHDRLRLEVSRGCTRGCRFCQAGMIYRPVRERSPQKLVSLAAKSIAATGYEDLSLLSLSTGDYGCIVSLMQQLMAGYAAENVAVSLPSLRAGTLTPELMQLIKAVRKTGFTIAPEAGSQRLRNVINKNISEEEIFETVNDAFQLGWQLVKLYFMVGLPTETQEDLEALVDLVRRLRKIKGPQGRKGKINVSVATFIPKPHTPFQWAPQITLAESIEKINWLKDQLRLPGIQVKWQNPQVSLLEGLWARGDRRLGRLLLTAYHKGCQFDGWTDQFRFDLWQEALLEEGIDIEYYTTRERDLSEPLAWDHIESRVTKKFFQDEWFAAVAGTTMADCRFGDCNQCGVCDFAEIEPRTFQSCELEPEVIPTDEAPRPTEFKKVVVSYSKTGPARFFGHLEMVNIFIRAVKRAAIPVRFSEGFHPKPKLAFDNPLPVGMESQEENFTMVVDAGVNAELIMPKLNSSLPEGLRVHLVRPVLGRDSQKISEANSYLVTLADFGFDEAELRAFIAKPDAEIRRFTKKGKLKKINIKDMLIDISLINPGQLQMTLRTEPGKMLRPLDVLSYIFTAPEDQLKQARITKLKA